MPVTNHVNTLMDGHHLVSRPKLIKLMINECFIAKYCIDGTYCKTVIGAVDYAWLFTYAVFMVARYK